MDGGTVFTILATAVTTLGATYFGNWLGFSKDRKLKQEELDRQARYLAIRVVCVLDPFVSACCDVVKDWGEEDQEGIMRPEVDSPTLVFPMDVDWKSIESDLMFRTLSLPNDVEVANQTIGFVGSVIAGPPNYEEYYEERILQFGRLGLIALAISDEYRKAYGIPYRNDEGRNPAETLKEGITKTEKVRDDRQAHQAKFMMEISSGLAAQGTE